MISQICEKKNCTGCSACRDACPRHCIGMMPDALDAVYPVIDNNKCIECGICKKTCPNNNEIVYHKPQKVWAAWSNDSETRKTSASGGIAYELYRYWINKGGEAVGVVYEPTVGCHYLMVNKETELSLIKNSKYTFSETAGIYKSVKERLQSGIPVLFIGMPCQVAGLLCFLKKEYALLTTVDIICHGMPPSTYLAQHIGSIERKKGLHAYKIHFRDPKYGTNTFSFTLKDNNDREFYKKRVLGTDNFQLGYHRALIYRENCYNCLYARKERISDLTIGDFSGIGSYAQFDYDTRNISCIIQNTGRGKDLLLSLEGAITMVERPEKEAFEIEKQLKSPSTKHIRRHVFEKVYKKTKDYETAANRALFKDKCVIINQLLYLKLKHIVRQLLVLLHLKKKYVA